MSAQKFSIEHVKAINAAANQALKVLDLEDALAVLGSPKEYVEVHRMVLRSLAVWAAGSTEALIEGEAKRQVNPS